MRENDRRTILVQLDEEAYAVLHCLVSSGPRHGVRLLLLVTRLSGPLRHGALRLPAVTTTTTTTTTSPSPVLRVHGGRHEGHDKKDTQRYGHGSSSKTCSFCSL